MNDSYSKLCKVLFGTLLFFLLAAPPVLAQRQVSEGWKKRVERLRQEYRQGLEERRENLRQLADSLGKVLEARHARTQRLARELDIPFTIALASGYTAQLRYITREGEPVYIKPLGGIVSLERVINEKAAEVIHTDDLQAYPWTLTGSGQRIGMWEAGGAPRKDHREFGSRMIWQDTNQDAFPNDYLQYHPNTPSGRKHDNHATLVGGTMIAEGDDDNAKGMAPQARMYAYTGENDLEEMPNAVTGYPSLKLSNHSYGLTMGWEKDANGNWFWEGYPDISEVEDWRFGFYTGDVQNYDEVAYNAPYYLIVAAVGNDRIEGPDDAQYPKDCSEDGGGGNGFLSTNNGYDCIPGLALAKNVLTVGSLEDDGTTIAEGSAFGPADDGRIKPDIMANGVELYSPKAYDNSGNPSTDDYALGTGTSFAAPSVTGSIALLRELAGELVGPGPGIFRSATYKALVIHTADELESVGPDYKTGWGRMNSLEAAKVIKAEQDAAGGGPLHIWQATLEQGKSEEFTFASSGGEVRVTLAWTDPPGNIPGGYQLDPTDKVLVNDLDLRVYRESNGYVYKPYRLNLHTPDAPAFTGDNNTDNVEQIRFTASPGVNYRVEVTDGDGGTLTGFEQQFSVVITGNSSFVPSDGGDDDDGGGDIIIDSDTTFSGEQYFDRDIWVLDGATLTIAQGTILKFSSDDTLLVKPGGRIVAEGYASYPIVFDERVDGQYWSGIVIRGDNSRFDYVEIRNAGRGTGDNARPALQIQARDVEISNAHFSDNAGVAIEASQTPDGLNSSFILTGSTLRENRQGISASHSDVILAGNTIEDNEWSGIMIKEGTHATIQYNLIEENSLEGVKVFGGTVDLFKNNTVRNNGQGGLDLALSAFVYLDGNSQNRIYNNGYHEVLVSLSSRAYLGDASYDEGGYNEIHDTGGYGPDNRYVKNTMSWTIPAEMNDWGGPSEQNPAPGMFDGPIDYEPYVAPPLSVSLFCMLVAGGQSYTCTAGASGGGGGYTYDWSGTGTGSCDGSSSCTVPCESWVSVTVTSTIGEQASNQTTTGQCYGGGGDCDDQFPKPIICEPEPYALSAYETLDRAALQKEIEQTSGALQEHPGATESAERLHRLYSLLLLKARVEQVRSRSGDARRTSAFSEAPFEVRSLFTGYAEAASNQAGLERRKAHDAARLILVEDLIRSGRPDQALQRARSYASSMSTAKGRARMHLQRVSALYRKSQFKQALQAADMAEQLWPERGGYASLRAMLLRHSGDLNRQDVGGDVQPSASQASTAKDLRAKESTEVLPEQFGLGAPYPNPTSGRVTLPLSLPERATVRVAVYDVLGRRVQRVAAQDLAAGWRELAFEAQGLSSGLYLIRVEITSASGTTRVFTEKVTLVR